LEICKEWFFQLLAVDIEFTDLGPVVSTRIIVCLWSTAEVEDVSYSYTLGRYSHDHLLAFAGLSQSYAQEDVFFSIEVLDLI